MKTRILLSTFIVAIVNFSCGVQTSLPTSEPVSKAVLVKSVKPEPTPTDVATEIPNTVRALGKVNVRVCARTSCEVIGQIEEGQIITVGDMITNDCLDCSRWYPTMFEKKDGEIVGAFACAEWFSK